MSFHKPEEKWSSYLENDQLKIEVMETRCNDIKNGIDNQYILLRFTNKTNHKIKVDYQRELWYNNICLNCNESSDENHKTIYLETKEVKTGNCSSDKSLKIFVRMNNNLSDQVLTKFELKELVISSI